MQRIALLSDIHANLHALQAVWDDLESQKPDAVYCLGDLVGYGAFPNEIVHFIQEYDIPTIMGNYDQGVGFDQDDCGCAYRDVEDRRLGTMSLMWTRKHTSDQSKSYLRNLPGQIKLLFQEPRLLLVHGSPRKINEYLYEDRPQDTFERVAAIVESDVLIFGHTHLPYTKSVSGVLFVNAGSVGKPKDGDPRAGYTLLTLGKRTEVVFRRVVYDIHAAARAVRESGLPDVYATMLESGGRETG
jgi:putative phosphoesterase